MSVHPSIHDNIKTTLQEWAKKDDLGKSTGKASQFLLFFHIERNCQCFFVFFWRDLPFLLWHKHLISKRNMRGRAEGLMWKTKGRNSNSHTTKKNTDTHKDTSMHTKREMFFSLGGCELPDGDDDKGEEDRCSQEHCNNYGCYGPRSQNT